MKRILLILSAVGLLTTVQSCTKKGENDPFLSFKSRNSRITGTWELTAMTSTYTNTYISGGQTTITTSTTTYDGTLLTTVSGGGSNSIVYSEEVTINKDGTYHAITVDDGDTYEQQGHWWWLDDKKKKTRIAFDDDWGSFEIDQLKDKEMILTQYEVSKSTWVGGDSDEDILEVSATYTKKK